MNVSNEFYDKTLKRFNYNGDAYAYLIPSDASQLDATIPMPAPLETTRTTTYVQGDERAGEVAPRGGEDPALLERRRTMGRNGSGSRFSRRMTPAQRASNFDAWAAGADVVGSEDAAARGFKTGEAVVVEAYHGTARPDRVGTVFQSKRATSGPMAFFTSDPTLASSYAQGKEDTSIGEDYDGDYSQWFKVKTPGQRARDVAGAWWYLTPEQRDRITSLAPRVVSREDDDGNYSIELGDESVTNGVGNYEWEYRKTRNPLRALVENWLASGVLFNEEQEFLKVLKAAGFPIVSGGTENHLFLVDLVSHGITGKAADAALGQAHITVNKNSVPNDPQSPFVTSGLRIGTPSVTTQGMGEAEMAQIAGFIARVLRHRSDAAEVAKVRAEVADLCAKFTPYV